MSKKVCLNDDLVRSAGSVFVNVSAPESVQQQQRAGSYFSEWGATAVAMSTEPHVEAPVEAHSPTANELLAAHLPKHIAETRWALYVTPGSKCHVFDGTTFIYHNPTAAWWNLYNLAKGIFRDLGISLSKSKGVWVARIPIKVLTDKVFVESGLGGVEATLRTPKDDRSFASKISNEIRHRQFDATRQGMSKVKRLRETLADAAGIVVITAISWLSYIVMGVSA